MKLKNHANEMSQKARAFSVVSLLSQEETENKFWEKSLRQINSRLQTRNGITAELCGNNLWEKFYRLGTEMIITKAGRRMFPTLKVRLHGLKLTANYIVYMDIVLAEEARYRYNFNRSEWIQAGPSNNFNSNNIYFHPDSPANGEVWMSHQNISFERVKLTNNKMPFMKDQVSLVSMHKYQPRVHVLEISASTKSLESLNLLDYVQEHSETSVTFTFQQTNFITVTAYQNREITKLKIQSNPFAKGFRETSNTKRKERRHECIRVCPIDINPDARITDLFKNKQKAKKQ